MTHSWAYGRLCGVKAVIKTSMGSVWAQRETVGLRGRVSIEAYFCGCGVVVRDYFSGFVWTLRRMKSDTFLRICEAQVVITGYLYRILYLLSSPLSAIVFCLDTLLFFFFSSIFFGSSLASYY